MLNYLFSLFESSPKFTPYQAEMAHIGRDCMRCGGSYWFVQLITTVGVGVTHTRARTTQNHQYLGSRLKFSNAPVGGGKLSKIASPPDKQIDPLCSACDKETHSQVLLYNKATIHLHYILPRYCAVASTSIRKIISVSHFVK